MIRPVSALGTRCQRGQRAAGNNEEDGDRGPPHLGWDAEHQAEQADRADRAALRPPFAEAGPGNGEFDILAALRRAGRPYARTPRELQRAMMVTSGAITKQVDRLERKGLVTRGPDPRDGRSRTVALTSAGRRLVDRLLPTHLANERDLLSTLTSRERDQLPPSWHGSPPTWSRVSVCPEQPGSSRRRGSTRGLGLRACRRNSPNSRRTPGS